MGINNARQTSFTNRFSRLSSQVNFSSIKRKSAYRDPCSKRQCSEGSVAPRGLHPTSKASDSPGIGLRSSYCFSSISRSKENGGFSHGLERQETEPPCRSADLQNGNPVLDPSANPSGRVGSIHRFEGRVFPYTNRSICSAPFSASR